MSPSRPRIRALALALLLVAPPALAGVTLREGRHPGFTRLVLDLPAGATASLSPDGTLTAWDASGAPLALSPPTGVVPIAATPDGTPALHLALPPDAAAHAWRLGTRFVLDISQARRLPLPPAEPDLAPTAPPPPMLADAQWDLPAAAFIRPESPQAGTPQAGTPQTAAGPPAPAAPPAPPRRDVALPYATTIPIAVFERAGHLLLVAADRAPPPPAVLGSLHATATPLPAGMLLAMPPGLTPVAEDGTWHLADAAAPPPLPMSAPLVPVVAQGRVTFAAATPGPVLTLRDPLHGGLLLVGTVASPNTKTAPAVATPWRTPFFALLPTLTGVAVAAHADAVQLRAVADGFVLDGGPVALPLGAFNAAAAATTGARLLDLPDLKLAALRRHLTDATLAAATAPPLGRAAARLREAQAMLALGMGAEAGSVLALAVNDDPRLGTDPRFRLATEAAAALRRDPAADPTELSATPCPAADEACLWRAVQLAARPDDRPGDRAAAAGMFAATIPIIDAYPPTLRNRLLPLAAETMLGAGLLAPAQALLAAHPADPGLRLARAIAREAALPPRSTGAGGRGGAARAVDAALAAYDALAQDPDRLTAFRAAFRAARLRAARGLATPTETAASLDKLRYAWRGDSRALALREALADARAEAGQWAQALSLLRQQTTAPDIRQKLATIFARAMADDASHPMPPLEFVTLVQSNPDLLPPGAPGDDILHRLARRLAALDLPDQAARVYAHMLEAMPPGIPRANVGVELAAQRLAGGDASGARAALDASAVAGPLPPELLEKRTLLFARAAAQLGDMPAAAASLAALGTVPALAERARLLEKQADWPAASVALQAYAAATVPPTGQLDATAADTLIRLATAAGRAGDASLLAALRDHDLGRMPPGHAADLFRMLTDPAALSTADLPRLAQTWGLPEGIAPALRAAGAQLIPPAMQ
jgi:hypothetical protein